MLRLSPRDIAPLSYIHSSKIKKKRDYVTHNIFTKVKATKTINREFGATSKTNKYLLYKLLWLMIRFAKWQAK